MIIVVRTWACWLSRAQVPDEPGAAEAPPEVREPELPGVHAREAVRAEAAPGHAEAAGDAAARERGARVRRRALPHDAGARCRCTFWAPPRQMACAGYNTRLARHANKVTCLSPNMALAMRTAANGGCWHMADSIRGML